ncbi:hypothetical protein D3C81_2340520 [compost metagenome]
MRKGLQGSRQDLHGTEAFVDGMRTALRKDPFENRHYNITDDKSNDRGEYQSLHNFDKATPLNVA